MFRITITRQKDRNVLPHVHLMLAFIFSLCKLTESPDSRQLGMYCVERIPWPELTSFLGKVIELEGVDGRTAKAGLTLDFPHPERGDSRPLPEDYLIRGLVWCGKFFPHHWFSTNIDEESRLLELASTHKTRAQRVIYLGICISKARHQETCTRLIHANL